MSWVGKCYTHHDDSNKHELVILYFQINTFLACFCCCTGYSRFSSSHLPPDLIHTAYNVFVCYLGISGVFTHLVQEAHKLELCLLLNMMRIQRMRRVVMMMMVRKKAGRWLMDGSLSLLSSITEGKNKASSEDTEPAPKTQQYTVDDLYKK